jgi:N-acyl amino acid synthase of PEP-CTERM/exosortase system
VTGTSQLFEFCKLSQADPLLMEVYRLRYKVYCDERGFEKPEDHPEGIEKDEFDKDSVHFLVTSKEEDRQIGTIRMILSSEGSLPIERHCKIDTDLSALDHSRICEISRLAVTKGYRRRITDAAIFDGKVIANVEIDNMFGGRRKINNDISLGLYKCIFQEMRERGHQYVLCVMTKGLYLLLKRIGVIFEPIGPEQYYHGLRTPYCLSLDTLHEGLRRFNPALYEAMVK